MLRVFFLLIFVLNFSVGVPSSREFSRDDFPPGFVFGSGTSAYQVEGAANKDGRTPSIWDTYAHAGKAHGATGDVACDGYHKYKEDVQLMVDIGLDAYRFSISWSRLIPNGRGPINPKGLQYYNNLINELVGHGIQPHVTLNNYDLPQALEDEYGGWVSRKIVGDFTEYAEVCFREFGDRVSYWTTVNEPNVFVTGGYDLGFVPPQRCSPPFGYCSRGNSSTEPYMAAHHILLAHASAARLYQKKYQEKHHGFIGLSIYMWGFVPLTDTKEDAIATQRAIAFQYGWFLDPLVFGDYPNIMKQNVGARMPAFTDHESKQVKGSFDFIGIVHYNNMYVKDKSNSLKMVYRDFLMDAAIELIQIQDSPSAFELPIMPWYLQAVLEFFKQVYGNPPIYIYENGQRMHRNSTLDDIARVNFMHAYIGGVLDALRNGSNTRGYFVWAFLDVFELLDGYGSSYGINYVDLDDPDLKRYPKLSAKWHLSLSGGGSSKREDGRTPSIWDTYADAGKAQGATGDVACDGYHKYREDVQLMVDVGLDAYRFSILWSRLVPNRSSSSRSRSSEIGLVAPHRIGDKDRSTSSQSQSLIVVAHRCCRPDSSPSSNRSRVDFNLENLPSDPGLRQKISSYHPNNHDEIRRHYLGKGPCRPPHDYPVSYFSGKPRRFRVEWYETRNWLEYSIAKDASFCFYCYLFGKNVGKQGEGDTFVTKGFRLWNQLGKLDSHVGGVNSVHNQAVKKSEDLQKEKQHIQSVLVKQ
ncbi:hypothetical protein ACJW31_10G105300 [Castanea mollissima]